MRGIVDTGATLHLMKDESRAAEHAFQAEANTCTRPKDMMLQIAAHRDHPSGQKSWMERQHDASQLLERQVHGWFLDNWRDRVAAATGTRPSLYVESNGVPIAPKTTSELYKRTDPAHIKMWDTALRKEWDGLCEQCGGAAATAARAVGSGGGGGAL
eukprot:COSAG01_NODE_2609_length_7389_cov_19.579467_10_plen_157_part_00